jgi:predicted nuclease of predicted toxin-antitoxin system
MGVSVTTVKALRRANHDAIHLRDEGLIRLADSQIAAKAVAESRIVLTFDLDFGDILAVARTEAPSVIIFRLRNQTPAAVNPRLFRVIAERAAELASGAIVIVSGARRTGLRFCASASNRCGRTRRCNAQRP